MKRTIRILAFAAVLGTAFFTSCEKNGLDINKGKAIRFSAVSSGTPTTKTSYGGDSDGYQIINWKANDTIRVYSDNAVHRYGDNQHWADYYTTNTTADGHKSTATLATETLFNTSDDNSLELTNGLVWGDAETYNFWAIYPSTKQNPDITVTDNSTVNAKLPISVAYASSTGSKTDNNITYSVYAPDMKYAYMTSHAEYAGEEVEENEYKVNLEFEPAFTAFELYLSCAADEANFSVNSVSLEGNEWLSGPFTMTAGDLSSVAAVDGASKTVTASFTTAVSITPTAGVNVTLFTIPKTNIGAISLKVATTEGTATLKFTKKGSSAAYPFEAGQKYRIHLLKVGGRWEIAFGGDMDVEPWEPNSTGLIVE